MPEHIYMNINKYFHRHQPPRVSPGGLSSLPGIGKLTVPIHGGA
jgi:hypothetical protein